MSYLDHKSFVEVPAAKNPQVMVAHEGEFKSAGFNEALGILALVKPGDARSSQECRELLKERGVELVSQSIHRGGDEMNTEEIFELAIDCGFLEFESLVDGIDREDVSVVREHFEKIKAELRTSLQGTKLKFVRVEDGGAPEADSSAIHYKVKREETLGDTISVLLSRVTRRVGEAMATSTPEQRGYVLAGATAAVLAVASPSTTDAGAELIPESAATAIEKNPVPATSIKINEAIPAVPVVSEVPFESQKLERDNEAISQALDAYYENNDRFFEGFSVSPSQISKFRKNITPKFNGNFGRHGIKDFIIDQDAAGSISKVLDYDMSEQMKELGELIDVPVQAQLNDRVGFRVGQVGLANHEIKTPADRDRNDPRALLMRLDTAQNMQLVADRLKQKLDAAKMADGWGVRMTVPGLLRPEELRKKVRNSSPHSPHLYGLGYDFSRTTFELVHDDVYGTYNLSRDQADHPKAVAILKVVDYLLAQTLIELHKEGSLGLTIEETPAHYHLTNRTLDAE